MAWTKFGAGTVTLTLTAGSAQSFAIEVKGGGIEHAYEDVGEDTTYLDGTTDPAAKVRGDTLTLDCDFDLSSPTGFYTYLFDNDLADATVDYTPNTVDGAHWTGTVRLQLPEEVTAEEFGAKIGGTVKLPFVGKSVFDNTTTV